MTGVHLRHRLDRDYRHSQGNGHHQGKRTAISIAVGFNACRWRNLGNKVGTNRKSFRTLDWIHWGLRKTTSLPPENITFNLQWEIWVTQLLIETVKLTINTKLLTTWRMRDRPTREQSKRSRMPSSSDWWKVLAWQLKIMSSEQKLANLSAIFALKKPLGKSQYILETSRNIGNRRKTNKANKHSVQRLPRRVDRIARSEKKRLVTSTIRVITSKQRSAARWTMPSAPLLGLLDSPTQMLAKSLRMLCLRKSKNNHEITSTADVDTADASQCRTTRHSVPRKEHHRNEMVRLQELARVRCSTWEETLCRDSEAMERSNPRSLHCRI